MRRTDTLDILQRRIDEAKSHPFVPAAATALMDTMAALLRDFDSRLDVLERAEGDGLAL